MTERSAQAEPFIANNSSVKRAWRCCCATLHECRSAVPESIGRRRPGGVSLVANATTAIDCCLSALGASFAPGATILTSDQEHPFVVRPLNMLAARSVEVIMIGRVVSGRDARAEIEEQVSANAKASVILSHVSYKKRPRPFRLLKSVPCWRATRSRISSTARRRSAISRSTSQRWERGPMPFRATNPIGGPWGTGGLWASEQLAAHNRFTLSNWASQRDPPAGGYPEGRACYALIAGLAEACRQARATLATRMRGLSRTQTAIRRRLEGIFPDADPTWNDGHAQGIVAYLMGPQLDSWTLAAWMLRHRSMAIKPFRPPEYPEARDSDFALFIEHPCCRSASASRADPAQKAQS